jgi:hypothetical protein
MPTIKVRSCSDCPFAYTAHMLTADQYCTADGELPFDVGVDPDHDRQPWCPLNAHDYTITTRVSVEVL